MLTLTDALRIGSHTLFRDVVYVDGKRSYTRRYFALPDRPQLATTADGRPAFDFLWYRRGLDDAAVGVQAGGLVTLTAELALPAAVRDELAAAVAATSGASSSAHDAPEVLPVPFTGGSVQLAFAGETGAAEPGRDGAGTAGGVGREAGDVGELASQVAGSGPARLAGAQRATFLVELTRDGASLLAAAIERGTELFQLRYDLTYEVRLGDVELRVWCDVSRSHELARQVATGGRLEPARLRDVLVDHDRAGVSLTSEQVLDPEQAAVLDELGRCVLEAALADAFLATDEVDGARSLRAPAAEQSSRVNFTLSQSWPVERHAVVSGPLLSAFGPDVLARHVRQITLEAGFFDVLEVTVLCPVDFDAGLIDKVHVTFRYDQTSPSGTRVSRSAELLFGSGVGSGTFRTDLATPQQRSYDYTAEVFYRGEREPLVIGPVTTAETIVVLDVDQLGGLRVAVALRDVPLDVIRTAVVELEHPEAASHRVILDAENPSAVWQAVIRTAPPAYRWRVTWLTVDDQRLEGPWEQASATTLALDGPAALRRRAQLLVVPGADFAEVASLVVELRQVDGPAATVLTFTGAQDTAVWEPNVADLATFAYDATISVVQRDGRVRSTGPHRSDGPVLVARDPGRFRVRVLPRRLDLGSRYALALVTLAGPDGSGPGDQRTLVFRHRDEEQTWSFPASPDREPGYRYQLTVIPHRGDRIVVPWRDADQEILVLAPPDDAGQ